MTYDSLASAEIALAGGDGTYGLLIIDGGLITGREGLFHPTGLGDVTVLELGTTCDDVAARAGLRLVLEGDDLAVRRDSGDEVIAHADTMTAGQALAFARRMSPFRPAATSTDGAVGVSLSVAWSELMGIADAGEV